MNTLYEKVLLKDYHFNQFNFANESDFEDIRKYISKCYEPKMVRADEMPHHEAIILKDGGVIITDDDDIDENGNHVFCTMNFNERRGLQFGSICGVPSDFNVCTLVLKPQVEEIYNQIHELENQINNIENSETISKLKPLPNYLSQEEYDFLTN